LLRGKSTVEKGGEHAIEKERHLSAEKKRGARQLSSSCQRKKSGPYPAGGKLPLHLKTKVNGRALALPTERGEGMEGRGGQCPWAKGKKKRGRPSCFLL